jgi:hypothetical protein
MPLGVARFVTRYAIQTRRDSSESSVQSGRLSDFAANTRSRAAGTMEQLTADQSSIPQSTHEWLRPPTT